MTRTAKRPLVWALLDGRAGHERQTLAVATHLSDTIVTHRLNFNSLAGIPLWLHGISLVTLQKSCARMLRQCLDETLESEASWPNIIVSTGRRTLPIALSLKNFWQKSLQPYPEPRPAHRRVPVLIQLLSPGLIESMCISDAVDIWLIPTHDRLPAPLRTHPHVVRTLGAPHDVGKNTLMQARTRWVQSLSPLPSPRLAVLLGGDTDFAPLPPPMVEDILNRADALLNGVGALMIAGSRRTSPAAVAALHRALDKVSVPCHLYLWQEHGSTDDNPYLGYLAYADGIIVTGESVSMCTEATGTPACVWVYDPPALVSPKHRRFLDSLYASGKAASLL